MSDYKINGTEFLDDPTVGNWVPRALLGNSGDGFPIYAGVRSYELSWAVATPAQFNQLIGWFNALGTTGTVVADLPEFGAASYGFTSYSGCYLSEPEFGRYFTEHYLDVKLVIRNIVTG